jgi:hypothetical protein
MVRLFETSDRLEEHLNRSNLRPDQVASINVDADGFFVLVYCVGGGPPEGVERRPAFREQREWTPRPPPRPRFEDEDEEEGEDRGFRPPPRRQFDRGDRPPRPERSGPPGRDFGPRRPPRR